MTQEKIDYADVIALGFNIQEEDDSVFFNQYGYPWKIITLDLTKKIYLNWDQETRLCSMIRVDKNSSIKAKMIIPNIESLKAIVNFYKTDFN